MIQLNLKPKRSKLFSKGIRSEEELSTQLHQLIINLTILLLGLVEVLMASMLKVPILKDQSLN